MKCAIRAAIFHHSFRLRRRSRSARVAAANDLVTTDSVVS